MPAICLVDWIRGLQKPSREFGWWVNWQLNKYFFSLATSVYPMYLKGNPLIPLILLTIHTLRQRWGGRRPFYLEKQIYHDTYVLIRADACPGEDLLNPLTRKSLLSRWAKSLGKHCCQAVIKLWSFFGICIIRELDMIRLIYTQSPDPCLKPGKSSVLEWMNVN